ncbi:hypothetical protein ABZV29_42340 [Streptomyces sp. NPDC005236]|uniref:hypothetical protein n=1 Tax=Streptomyces sp. NPDC005236 TaxID=3157028 RepID=UPI00339EA63A
MGVRVPSITAWEAGRAEPKGERLEAYRRLLEGLAHRYPPGAPAGLQDARCPLRSLLRPLRRNRGRRPRARSPALRT